MRNESSPITQNHFKTLHRIYRGWGLKDAARCDIRRTAIDIGDVVGLVIDVAARYLMNPVASQYQRENIESKTQNRANHNKGA